jgi:two-component system, OmpR family, phosphate regulon response regulator PhoB
MLQIVERLRHGHIGEGWPHQRHRQADVAEVGSAPTRSAPESCPSPSLCCRAVGLDLGADDYLMKPFSPGELAARARSVLRRTSGLAAESAKPFEPVGSGLELDRATRQVWVDGAPVELAAKEFDLLVYFVDHPKRACTRSELLGAVWASHAGWQTEATVTEHVYRLRLKIEADPRRPRWLHTVRSVGYRWLG